MRRIPLGKLLLRMAVGLFFLGCGCRSPVPVVIRPVSSGKSEVTTAIQRAYRAWDGASTNDPSHLSLAVREYNEALLELLRSWPRGEHGQFVPWHFESSNRLYQMGVQWAAPDYPPDYFDQIVPAEALKFKGISHYAPTGWGQPLVGVVTNRGLLPEEAYFPPEGIVRSLTAMLDFGVAESGRSLATLVLYQPDRQPEVEIAGQPQPLAADYSAAYAVLLSRTKLKGSGLRAFLNRQAFGREAGIFLMEPYRPDKIPVLMVHGLASSPLAWAELTDALWANPALHAHFQVWHYFYPTTFPYLHSAAELHDNLAEIRSYFDPKRESPAFRHLVVVGHSMGGLLARRLVTESGDTLWTNAFTRPLEQMNCTREERDTLHRYFFFHPDPDVGRVIFMATPHRGSNLAAGWEGRVGRTLADQDPAFANFFRSIALRNPDSMTARMRKWSEKRRLSSVQVLSSENPVLRAMSSLPFAPQVKVNSIVGVREKSQGPNSGDGVVTYDSAHLNEAETEFKVSSGHAVNRHPEAVAEVLRILHRHWEQCRAQIE
jgi:pimeloyl-ACP methyl ester carboxylesterase